MKVKIKLKESNGILGKRVWPSANPMYQKHLDIFGEPDTEIERKLYLQLHKHFNTTSAWVKDNEPPLDAESVKALKSILSSGEYAEDFRKCNNPQGTMLRGMFVPLEWVRQNAPGALEAMSSDTGVIDWNKPFPTNFTYKSQGKYGGVSSWTPNKRVARIFAGNRTPGGEINCVLYAKCDSGLFMSTEPFAKYKDGEYKKDHGIKRLNPAKGEQEFLLFGECQVVAIQLRGPRKNEESKMNITSEQLQRIIKEELEAVMDEKKKAKKDACYRKVKSRYKVWPSAYASGALVKCRKKGAKNWGNKSEGQEDESLSDLEKMALDKFKEEGGAAGEGMMIDFLKEKGASEEQANKILDKVSDVHQDGDLVTPMNEEELDEKKKKPCKKAKGKKFVKRVNGRCRSFGQSGQAKGGGARIRPGTKKGDAYCARSAKIKKCKNPPCANALSRKKWKCRGSKSMKEAENDQG